MKNKLALTAAIVVGIAAQSSAFYKMSFTYASTPDQNHTHFSDRISNSVLMYEDIKYVFLYDKNTHICFYSDKCKETYYTLSSPAQFLNCDFEFEKVQKGYSYSWNTYLENQKDKLFVNLNDIFSQNIPNIFANCYEIKIPKHTTSVQEHNPRGMHIDVVPNNEHIPIIQQLHQAKYPSGKPKEEKVTLSQDLTSLSGVQIHNDLKNGIVTISKGGKSVDFKQAITQYIKILLDPAETADKLSVKMTKGEFFNFIRSIQKEALFTPECLKMLENPNIKILSIWHMLDTRYINPKNPNQHKDVNQRLIGLAKDESTGEYFHWCTDLGLDIEVLIDGIDKEVKQQNDSLVQEQDKSGQINHDDVD